MATFVTTQDIVIPAGTVLSPAPGTTINLSPHLVADIGHGTDIASSWAVDLQEAIDVGLVRVNPANG